MNSGAILPDHARDGPIAGELRSRLADAERERDRLTDALREADAHQRKLADELQHRVRNMLSVLRSVLRRTWEAGASQDGFFEHFQGRLDAIARYQSEAANFRSTGTELEDVIRDQLLEVHCADGDRLRIGGPAVYLRGKTLELLALAVHELTTNSIKFGALAGNGRLDVSWSVTDETVMLDWHESGVVPLAPAPRARGFGRQFIEEALPYQLGAETSFELGPGSFRCTIALRLPGEEITVGRTPPP